MKEFTIPRNATREERDAIIAQPVTPREWFLVPVFIIDEVVEKIRDGTITGYVYDPKTASLRHA